MLLSKKEILRYLGYKQQKFDENIKNLLEECIVEIKNIINPKTIYKIYDIEKINDTLLNLSETNIQLNGTDINKHLQYSNKCAIIATTLGIQTDAKINFYTKTNLTKAIILDACATVAIESICDDFQKELVTIANKNKLKITYRYSPGYGDFPISTQPDIINLLEAPKKIGLTVNESNILIPRKSVTAIIGFQDMDKPIEHPNCKKCNNYNQCSFRKDGDYCAK